MDVLRTVRELAKNFTVHIYLRGVALLRPNIILQYFSKNVKHFFVFPLEGFFRQQDFSRKIGGNCREKISKNSAYSQKTKKHLTGGGLLW